MINDIRINLGFRDSRKRKRLAMALGLSLREVGGLLVDFWLAIAQDHPDGDISSWDETDIALACSWDGDATEFVKILTLGNWIKTTDSGYTVNDWVEHQPWAIGAETRSDIARLGALVRYKKDLAPVLKKCKIRSLSPEQFTILRYGNPSQYYNLGLSDEIVEQLLQACYKDAALMPLPHAPAPAPAPNSRKQVANETAPSGLGAGDGFQEEMSIAEKLKLSDPVKYAEIVGGDDGCGK